jgi:hypothetical protein
MGAHKQHPNNNMKAAPAPPSRTAEGSVLTDRQKRLWFWIAAIAALLFIGLILTFGISEGGRPLIRWSF